MDFKKLWPTLLPIIPLVLSVFTDQIGAFIVAHPSVALLLATLNAALANVVNPTKKPAA